MPTSWLTILLTVHLSNGNKLLDHVKLNEAKICKGNIIRTLYDIETSIMYVRQDEEDFNVYVGDRSQVIFSPHLRYENPFKKQYNFVIPARNGSSLVEICEELWSKHVWNKTLYPRRSYLIFLEVNENIDEIFDYLKELFIIKVILVVLDDDLTYTLYRNVNFCLEVSYAIERGNCNDIKKTTFLKRTMINLNGCSMRVVALPFVLSDNYAGYDPEHKIGITLRPLILLERLFGLNVSVIIPSNKEQDYLASPENDATSFNGDILASTLFRQFDNYKNFELSRTIIYEKVIWLVSKPEKYSNLETTLRIFSYKILIIYMTIFIIIVTIDTMYENLICPSREKDLGETILHLFVLALGSCVKKLSNNSAKRLFLAFYLYFSLLSCTIFHTKLSSILTVPMYERPINSMEELIDSSYTIFMRRGREFYYENSTYPLAKKLLKRTTFFSLHNITVSDTELVAQHPKSATHSRMLKTTIGDLMKFHKFNDDIISTMDMAYVLPSGSYYMYYINFIIARVQEHGFLVKWANDILYGDIPTDPKEIISLNISHFEAAFVAWMTGILLSTLLFLGELFWYKWKK